MMRFIFTQKYAGLFCLAMLLPPVSMLNYASCHAFQLTFQPRITEALTYTDNLFLDSGDDPNNPKESDVYSLLTPGFTTEIMTRTLGASLSYDFGYTRYVDWSSRNSWNHNMGMNGWYDLSRHTRFEIRNNLVYTEDPISDRNFEITRPPESTLPEDYTTRRDRQPYLTNYADFSFSHQFGPDDSIVISYGNGIRHDFSSSRNYQSSEYMRHTPSATITYWFNPGWGIELEGTYDQGNFKDQSDTKSGTARFRLNHRFNPHTTMFYQYSFYTISYDEDETVSSEDTGFSQDYDTHDMVIGFNYSLSRDFSIECHAGGVVQVMDQGDKTPHFSGGLSLNKTFQHGSIRLYGESGQAQGVFTNDSVGPSFFFETGLSGTYQILERLGCNAYVSFRRDNFKAADNDYATGSSSGHDDNYGAGAGINWAPYTWLRFNLSYSFNHLDSGRDAGLYNNSYYENRGMLNIVLTTPRPWRTTR